MSTQIPHSILMIRPKHFGFNEETATDNAFQKNDLSGQDIQGRALREFDAFREAIEDTGVKIHLFDDQTEPILPDAVFSNNWISMHGDGSLILYPLYARSRRAERRQDIVNYFSKHYTVRQVLDWTSWEFNENYLESTGSLVLDRRNRLAYACLSERTRMAALESFCQQMNYTAVPFRAYDSDKRNIYHTNVMLHISESFVVICAEAIADQPVRKRILQQLHDSGRTLIEISQEQLQQFAGNLITLSGKHYPVIAMSTQAFMSLDKSQIRELEHFGELIHSPLDTIERLGGGSARCMITGVFLPEIRTSPPLPDQTAQNRI